MTYLLAQSTGTQAQSAVSAQNRRVRQLNSALRHHLDQVPRAQFVAEIPAHAKHNDFPVEMPSPKTNPMLSSWTIIAGHSNRLQRLHQNPGNSFLIARTAGIIAPFETHPSH